MLVHKFVYSITLFIYHVFICVQYDTWVLLYYDTTVTMLWLVKKSQQLKLWQTVRLAEKYDRKTKMMEQDTYNQVIIKIMFCFIQGERKKTKQSIALYAEGLVFLCKSDLSRPMIAHKVKSNFRFPFVRSNITDASVCSFDFAHDTHKVQWRDDVYWASPVLCIVVRLLCRCLGFMFAGSASSCSFSFS